MNSGRAVVFLIGFSIASFYLPMVRAESQPGPQKDQSRLLKQIEHEVVKERRKKEKEEKASGRKVAKQARFEPQEPKKPIVWTSPYATTEELLLPRETAELRRAFETTEPIYFGGKVVEEQALFEALARRDEEALYEAIEIAEEKPWWRDVLESFSAITQYKQGFHKNYFNTRARKKIWTENPFFGLRVKRWGVLSGDANYFVSLERLSFEKGQVSIDPHIVKTHGGQAKLLYHPSKRFHVLVQDNVRKSNKIIGVEGQASDVSLGNNVVSNTVGAEFRYFLTQQDVIDLAFNYDYSRVRSNGTLQISRGYEPKISFIKSFGPRLILRGFLLHDYLKTVNPSTAPTEATATAAATQGTAVTTFTSFRYEPGLGGTFVLGRLLVLDGDYSKQRLRFRESDKVNWGDRVNVRLNHQVTNRLRQSYAFNFSKLEGKRSAISKVDKKESASFEEILMSSQFSYLVTPLLRLGTTLEYSRTDTGSTPNNRKRIVVEVARPVYRNRAELTFTYTFDKNDGTLGASYFNHTWFLTLKVDYGAGRVK